MPLVITIFAWTFPVSAENPADIIEALTTGSINWTAGTVSATGTSSPAAPGEKSEKNQVHILGEAREKAFARLDLALRHVRLSSGRRVVDLLNEKRTIAEPLHKLTRSAKVAHHRYLSDGTVAVEVIMHLHGGAAQLLLPEEIRQVQTVTAVSETTPDDEAKAAPPRGNHIEAVPPPFTGLVLDARGVTARPALTMAVKDETGRVVYGAAFVSREFAVQKGMSGFTVSAAPERWGDRVGSRPLVCRVLQTYGEEHTNYVISNADAATLRGAVSHLGFLRECRVIVVMEPLKSASP